MGIFHIEIMAVLVCWHLYLGKAWEAGYIGESPCLWCLGSRMVWQPIEVGHGQVDGGQVEVVGTIARWPTNQPSTHGTSVNMGNQPHKQPANKMPTRVAKKKENGGSISLHS